jgi:Tat protein secretion system quality control protein TatD with DNase activity
MSSCYRRGSSCPTNFWPTRGQLPGETRVYVRVATRGEQMANMLCSDFRRTPKAWSRNLELTQSTKHVRAALGLHPQLVMERSDEVSVWEQCSPQARYIGEVGIDAGPRYYRALAFQKHVFERHLRQCAAAGGKVLTVHSVQRRSFSI